ncbi:large conductance mechanosensitive channel protein MscL [uncultured Vagococcus sp.]|uniref:large conductance mechanosensitive channel protein MscL n=1 Tax=uncultured Vagococcus sp. TaxID=189676 RepID=UPI0028D4C25B|nr:large conductance mechanosensitive channel protein MscL [uncultured Vagococcus sp.]
MVKEFKEFIMRGNVLDLAVGVVIGGAFTAIVASLVDGLITPIIALVFLLITGNKDGTKAIEGMSIDVYGVPFDYGKVIGAVITFLITAFVVFMIVKAINKAREAVIKPVEEVDLEDEFEQTEKLLTEIRDLLAQQNGQAVTKTTLEQPKEPIE